MANYVILVESFKNTARYIYDYKSYYSRVGGYECSMGNADVFPSWGEVNLKVKNLRQENPSLHIYAVRHLESMN